jgi:hypothetical protein
MRGRRCIGYSGSGVIYELADKGIRKFYWGGWRTERRDSARALQHALPGKSWG